MNAWLAEPRRGGGTCRKHAADTLAAVRPDDDAVRGRCGCRTAGSPVAPRLAGRQPEEPVDERCCALRASPCTRSAEEQRDGLLAPRVPAAVVLGELHLDWRADLRARGSRRG